MFEILALPCLNRAERYNALVVDLRVQAGDGDAEDFERELQDAHMRAADAVRKYRAVRSLCLVAQQARTPAQHIRILTGLPCISLA